MKTTLRHAQLILIPQNEEYICKIAKNVDGARELIEAGFECVTDLGSCKLFHKMKPRIWGPRPSERARSLGWIRTLACGAGDPGFKSQRARQNSSRLNGTLAAFDLESSWQLQEGNGNLKHLWLMVMFILVRKAVNC